ncbi:LPXTG cell wall anchor domain-containing protein [Promicromonospora sp. NPDC060204]|uniref:LPXTG cell wall anchor domain-containing protein n=1 Tax=Promicromonospora sp. NPDC060204 TaxID=3347071 RepID=UPI003651C14D
MRKMTVLGASALLVAGLLVPSTAAFAAPVAGAPVATTGSATCPKDGKVDVSGEHTTLVVTAPDGYLITGYCVKAGSANQGLGPEDVVVDPPAAEVTISHSSGKAISHYTLITVKAEPTPEPSVPGEEPTVPGEEPGEEPTDGTGTEPSEPAVEEPEAGEPEEGNAPAEESAPATGVDATASPSAEEPGELAATGASTVIGFTLIALALVGGGVTLLVLRRKGALSS